MYHEKSTKLFSLPLLLLMAFTFVLGTGELGVVGILPQMAEGFHVSLAAVGRLVSIFAVSFALSTPILTAATGRIPRIRLLAGLLVVFLGANALSLLAPNVLVLYVSRALTALASGSLTVLMVLFAREVSPPALSARAISLIYTSFSIAAILGVPLSCTVCRLFGWRWLFVLVLGMTLLLTPALLYFLPRTDAPGAVDGGFFRQFAVFRDRRMVLCAGMLVCSAAATYTVYTFFSPLLTGPLGLPDTAVSPLLMGMGLCLTGSNLLSGKLGECGGVQKLPLPFLLQALLLILLPLLLRGRWAGLLGLFVMGGLMYLLNTPVQLYVLGLAEREYPFATTLCASVQMVFYNFGIALGSLVGGAVQSVWGLELLGLPAAAFALGALVLNFGLLHRAPAARRTVPG